MFYKLLDENKKSVNKSELHNCFIMKIEFVRGRSDISSYTNKCFLINVHIRKCVLFDCQTCLFVCKSINYVIFYDEMSKFLIFVFKKIFYYKNKNYLKKCLYILYIVNQSFDFNCY